MVASDRAIERVAESQHGLVTKAQGLDAGLTERQVRRRVAEGRWIVLDRRLYRLGGAPETWRQTVMAHCLGLEGIASHWTAAHLWGLASTSGQKVHIAVPAERHRLRPGVFVHQYSQHALFEPDRIDGIPVTPAAVTALDLCGRLSLEKATAIIDTGRRMGLFEWGDLVTVLLRHARKGRNGIGTLRDVLDRYHGQEAIPDSGWNRAVAVAVENAGLPAPVMEWEVILSSGRRVRFDLGWPDLGLAVELQSVYHLTADQLTLDADKSAGAEALGITVLPFTVEQWTTSPASVVLLIGDAIRRRLGADAAFYRSDEAA